MKGFALPTSGSTAVTCVAIALGIALVDCGGGSDHVNDVIDTPVFEAALTGANEVPPVQSSGSGTADLIGNRALNTIAFDVRTSGLGSITGMQIQVADPGANGPVIFVLSSNGDEAVADTLGSNDLIAQPDLGINDIDDAINAMVDGRTYVNVTTETFPDGEIRGQIMER